MSTKGTHAPNSCPLSASPAPPPTPTPTHLGRWALQGVAVQQNDLQVPEAAEGDRDAGDTVTGEIQADKRKVPQLWGWVREKSGACSGAGPCAHFLCPQLACHLSGSPSALVGGGRSPGTTALLLCPLRLQLLPIRFSSLPTPPHCRFLLLKCPSQGPNQTDTLLLKSLPGLAARAAAGERAVSCTKARQKGAATPRRSTGQALAHPQENGTLLHFSERAPGLVMSRGTDENRCSLVEQHSLVKEFMTWLCPHSPPRFPPSHHIRPPSSPLAPASPYAVCSARRAPAFYPCIFPGSA